MDFEQIVRRRRMVRDFLPDPVDPRIIDRCVDLASRSPSAGKSQGWHLIVLEGAQTARYWDLALPIDTRAAFGFPGLLSAPVLMVVCADPAAYLERYSEPDKAATGLGSGPEAWPAPYWTVDASFATMVLLLALENEGLGALFFAHAAEQEIRREFAIPRGVIVLGVIATGQARGGAGRRGRSASRARRGADRIIHRGRW